MFCSFRDFEFRLVSLLSTSASQIVFLPPHKWTRDPLPHSSLLPSPSLPLVLPKLQHLQHPHQSFRASSVGHMAWGLNFPLPGCIEHKQIPCEFVFHVCPHFQRVRWVLHQESWSKLKCLNA